MDAVWTGPFDELYIDRTALVSVPVFDDIAADLVNGNIYLLNGLDRASDLIQYFLSKIRYRRNVLQ